MAQGKRRGTRRCGAPLGNRNRLRKLGGFSGYDLKTLGGLNAALEEATRQHLSGEISVRQLSAITTSLTELIARKEQEQPPASSVDADATDPVAKLRANLGWEAFPYQRQLLSDHKVKVRIIRKARQVGCTEAVSFEALWKCFTTKRLVLFITPVTRQSLIPLDKILQAVKAHPNVMKHVTRETQSEL